MLSKITLKNFKLHTKTVIDAAPVTVFIGPNNSGKSSLFQALLGLRQAAAQNRTDFCIPRERQGTSKEKPYLFHPEEIVNIGDFTDIVRLGETEIQVGVAGTIPRIKPFKFGVSVKLDFEVYVRENHLVHHRGNLECSFGSLAWQWFARSSAPSSNLSIPINQNRLFFQAGGTFSLLTTSGASYPENTPPEDQLDLEELRASLRESPVHLLNSLHPIFPLRGFEEYGYPLPENSASNLDRLALSDRAIALASILAYHRDTEEKLSDWLEELLRVKVKVKLLPGKRVVIRSVPTGKPASDLLFANEGTGANQLPFILLPMGLTPTDSTVLFCEPEAHLHPKAQSELLSLLLKIAKSENRQFLIETHSEHVLHRILNAVAKGELETVSLALYYFENRQGEAHVEKLEVDEKGRVEGGLPGFFDHSLNELSEYLDALKKN